MSEIQDDANFCFSGFSVPASPARTSGKSRFMHRFCVVLFHDAFHNWPAKCCCLSGLPNRPKCYMDHNVLLMIRVVAKLHRSPTTPANFNISQHPLIILVPELDPAIKQATDVSNV